MIRRAGRPRGSRRPHLQHGRLDVFRVSFLPLPYAPRRLAALSGCMDITSRTDDPILLTVPEAARRLSIGRTMTYELIAARELPAVHIGRAVRIPADALEAFVARRLQLAGGAVSD
jgi:excisionase family DNA binding protein